MYMTINVSSYENICIKIFIVKNARLNRQTLLSTYNLCHKTYIHFNWIEIYTKLLRKVLTNWNLHGFRNLIELLIIIFYHHLVTMSIWLVCLFLFFWIHILKSILININYIWDGSRFHKATILCLKANTFSHDKRRLN